jgi:hypothetical protein
MKICIDKMMEGKKQVLGTKHTTTFGTIGEPAIYTWTKAQ